MKSKTLPWHCDQCGAAVDDLRTMVAVTRGHICQTCVAKRTKRKPKKGGR